MRPALLVAFAVLSVALGCIVVPTPESPRAADRAELPRAAESLGAADRDEPSRAARRREARRASSPARAPSKIPVGEQIPFAFEGQEGLTFRPSPAFDLTSGTIEFWVEAGWEDELGYEPAILAVGDGRETRFSVHLTYGADGVGLFNGSAGDFVSHDFAPFEPYHVALVIHGERTRVYVDGDPIADLAVGLGRSRGLPLQIGASGPGGSGGAVEAFVGRIGTVRLWNRPFPEAEVGQLAALEQGLPGDYRYLSHLVGFSDLRTDAIDFLANAQPALVEGVDLAAVFPELP